MYTVDYFIRKFENTELGGGDLRACALGKCGVTDYALLTQESIELVRLFTIHLKTTPLSKIWKRDIASDKKMYWIVININDGLDIRYQQSSPKQRILAALHDIKKMQEPKRKKVKPEIASDLLTPPIPKEVEKLDHFTPEEIKTKAEDFASEWADKIETIPCIETALSDYNKSLDSFGKSLQKTADLLLDFAYDGYRRARMGNHFLTPEFYEGIYKREDIEIMEERFQREQNELEK